MRRIKHPENIRNLASLINTRTLNAALDEGQDLELKTGLEE